MYFNGDINYTDYESADYYDNYMNLVTGVIAKAADDYRFERKRLKKFEQDLANCEAISKREELQKQIRSSKTIIATLRKFFTESPWLNVIQTNGSYILTKLDEEFEQKDMAC